MSEREGWPEVVDVPDDVKKGDRLRIVWRGGVEEFVTVDDIHDLGDGSKRFSVTLDPPPDLHTFYYRP